MSEQVKIASVDVGDAGLPGTQASKLTCTITRVRPGRYEASCESSVGVNQGYYEENYSFGPWRGRGDSPEEAVESMLGIVDAEYHHDMKRAAQEALIEAEDFLEDEAEES